MPFGNAVVTCYVTSRLNSRLSYDFGSILAQTLDAARRDCIPTRRVGTRKYLFLQAIFYQTQV